MIPTSRRAAADGFVHAAGQAETAGFDPGEVGVLCFGCAGVRLVAEPLQHVQRVFHAA